MPPATLAPQAGEGPENESLELPSKATHCFRGHSCNPSTVGSEAGGSLGLSGWPFIPGPVRDS